MEKERSRTSGNSKVSRNTAHDPGKSVPAGSTRWSSTTAPSSAEAQVLGRHQRISHGSDTEIPLADDLIWSARAIAAEVYGVGDSKHQRKIFHLFATSRTPIVKIGSTYVVRRSTLRRWIEQMEQQGLSGKRGIPPILREERILPSDDPTFSRLGPATQVTNPKGVSS